MIKPFVTTETIMEWFHYKYPDAVYKLVKKGVLPAVQLTEHSTLLFPTKKCYEIVLAKAKNKHLMPKIEDLFV
jgi:hypothetical protein